MDKCFNQSNVPIGEFRDNFCFNVKVGFHMTVFVPMNLQNCTCQEVHTLFYTHISIKKWHVLMEYLLTKLLCSLVVLKITNDDNERVKGAVALWRIIKTFAF